jgi:ubiquitin-activating enzyme E1 C
MAQQEPEAQRARTTPPGEASASSAAAGAGAGGGGRGGGSPAAPAPAGQGFCLQQSAEWPLLSRASPFPNEAGSLGFTAVSPGEGAVAALDKPVLVVGAGGLGCEVLKNLALSGVRNIHVVDMDVRAGRAPSTPARARPLAPALIPPPPSHPPLPPQTIDLTNLNRQFLFRMKDVGAPKASTAAAFVSARVQGVRVRPWTCSVQDMVKEIGDAELRKFGAVVGCLDSLEVRRWLNSKMCEIAPVDKEGALTALPVPYVDGGSEAFKGHVKVILPKFTACLECGIANFTAPVAVPMCTLVSKPRKPEHCVAYVMEVEWSRAFGARAFDTDSREDMEWINAQALARAEHFGIPGVNYTFTLGAVKNIIPAIAATNAVVSAGALRCAERRWPRRPAAR